MRKFYMLSMQNECAAFKHFFILFILFLVSFCEEIARADMEGWGDEWDWGTYGEIHKESLKT